VCEDMAILAIVECFTTGSGSGRGSRHCSRNFTTLVVATVAGDIVTLVANCGSAFFLSSTSKAFASLYGPNLFLELVR